MFSKPTGYWRDTPSTLWVDREGISFMDMIFLCQGVRAAVADDATLKNWSTANYSQVHKVFLGIDTNNPPGDAQYPLVHIFPLQKIAGDGTQFHVMGMTTGIHNSDLRTGMEDNAEELAGMQDLETFRKYTENAVLQYELPDDHYFAGLEINYETIEFFPFFLCAMEFHIRAEFGMDDDFYQ